MSPSRRVRTGCITCRSRRVKCDEGRPVCYNCTRLNRACLYQPPALHHFNTISSSLPTPISWNELQSIQCNAAIPSAVASDNMQESFVPRQDMVDEALVSSPPPDLGQIEMSLDLDLVTGEWGDLFTLDSSKLFQGQGPSPTENSPSSHAGLVDVASTEISTPTDFTYFLESVEPPFITPWDSKNWGTAKAYIIQLANASSALAAAITAVESLYTSLTDSTDISSALSQYFSAKSQYFSLIKDNDCDIELAIIITFIHCCFEVATQQETISDTLKRTSSLITRLKERPIHQHCSPIVRRVCTWLCLFHTKAMHLGGRGILSPQLLSTLQHQYQHQQQQPFLHLDPGKPDPTSLSSIAADSLHHCIFQFYCELQWISTTVSDLNRHHRPRGSAEDETEVARMAKDVRQNLTYLWEGRPRIVDASSADIAQNLPPSTSPNALASLIELSQLCRISYNAEVIYHARGSGEFNSLSPIVVNARLRIRNEVDEMLANHTTQQGVSPALIWPLFQYAVESTTEADILWAVQRLKLIKNQLWSSEYVVSFIEALSAEQLRKGDRVDSRFFCIQQFGTIPPFI